ncbi:MAG: ThiF family adenylyltransferase [Acidobacteriota bacterium]
MEKKDLLRYSRQTIHEKIGIEGQKKLKNSFIAIIGCGGLGSNVADHLARAGVGKIKIIDRDFVEIENLQRQVLFDEDDVKNNLPKAIAAAEKIKKINSEVEIEPVVTDFNFTNAENLIKGVDLVIDGLDNFETRFLINEACVKNNIPWIYGTCVSSYGFIMNIIPHKTPCLRCILDPVSPGQSFTCETVGILGPTASTIASLESVEAIKFLLGNLDALNKNLTFIDIWTDEFEKIDTSRMKKEDCSVCVQKKFDILEQKKSASISSLCGRNAVQIIPSTDKMVNLVNISKRLENLGKVFVSEHILIFKINEYEITLFPDGRAIIKGTDNESVAKKIYTQYIGM